MASIHFRCCLYNTTAQEPSEELEMICALDEPYTEDPSRGVYRMLYCINNKGYKTGRYRIRRMMKRISLKIVYCPSRTTVINHSKYKYPYFLPNLKIERQSNLGNRHHQLHHQMRLYALCSSYRRMND